MKPPCEFMGACAINLATSGAVAWEVMGHIGLATNSSYKRCTCSMVGNIMVKIAASENDRLKDSKSSVESNFFLISYLS